jgi:hypothetical protein
MTLNLPAKMDFTMGSTEQKMDMSLGEWLCFWIADIRPPLRQLSIAVESPFALCRFSCEVLSRMVQCSEV